MDGRFARDLANTVSVTLQVPFCQQYYLSYSGAGGNCSFRWAKNELPAMLFSPIVEADTAYSKHTITYPCISVALVTAGWLCSAIRRISPALFICKTIPPHFEPWSVAK